MVSTDAAWECCTPVGGDCGGHGRWTRLQRITACVLWPHWLRPGEGEYPAAKPASYTPEQGFVCGSQTYEFWELRPADGGIQGIVDVDPINYKRPFLSLHSSFLAWIRKAPGYTETVRPSAFIILIFFLAETSILLKIRFPFNNLKQKGSGHS